MNAAENCACLFPGQHSLLRGALVQDEPVSHTKVETQHCNRADVLYFSHGVTQNSLQYV